MGNLPKIWANCKAGCAWETVHRSEFEQAATFMKQEKNAKGCFELEIGKEYKVISPVDKNFQFTDSVFVPSTDEDMVVILPRENKDEYAKSYTIRVLDIQQWSVVYEFAGVRYRARSDVHAFETKTKVFVSGATECYLYNTDAQMKVEAVSVVNAYLTPEKNLIIVLSDGTEIDAGCLLDKPITFTVDGVSYTAIEGQTWGDFVEEHSGDFAINWQNEIYDKRDGCSYISYPNSVTVRTNETIQADTAYIYTMPHGA